MTSDRKAALRADLAAALQEVLALVADLPPEHWERRTPTADGWTVRDTLSHLVTGEAGNLFIARGIAAGQDLYRPDFDLDRYNRRNIEKHAARTPQELLTELQRVRQETLTFLDSLDEATLLREGRRTTGEWTTVEGVFRRIADHQREHAAEIRAALSGAPAE